MVPIDASFIDPIHIEKTTGKSTQGARSGGGEVISTMRDLDDLNEMEIHNQRLQIETKRRLGLYRFFVSD